MANCSPIDDVIIFYRDGKYVITPVADKKFVGNNILYINIFKKNDKRTIYNVAYRDGKDGTCYMKRFAVTGIVRDREYDLTQGKPDSPSPIRASSTSAPTPTARRKSSR